jgi:hypothetical protein
MTGQGNAAALDIRRPAAIDAPWLTRALQSAGIDAVVRAFSANPVGTGQIGDSVRFTLTYERGGEFGPATLVGKFPSPDASSFKAGVTGGNYVREVMFYRHLASTALVSTPRWYVAEVDEVSGEFVLLLEDLAPAEQGDQLKGVSLDQARLVVDEAAKLHGSHWGDESLNEHAWMVGSHRASRTISPEDIQALERGFRERYAERLAPAVAEASAYLAARIQRFRILHQGPRCVIHYDFRPDNMMFASPAGGRPVTVLDWQSVGLGTGPVDLAYFLAGALAPDVRRAHEAALLARYHEGLIGLGVRDYDTEALRRGYALGGLRLLMIAFMSSMRVKQTARGDAMFMQMAHAATEHIFDNRALELLA